MSEAFWDAVKLQFSDFLYLLSFFLEWVRWMEGEEELVESECVVIVGANACFVSESKISKEGLLENEFSNFYF